MSPACIRSPASPAGGRPWSAPASRSTPSAISSSARMWSAPAWARPARPRPIRRPASPGASISRSSPSATWCARRRCCSIISASTRCSRSPAARWAACRCCNGRRAIRSACSAALPIACATRHSAQNIAFHEVGRQAVMADPEWRGGRYLIEGTNPRRGLAVARMGAHITYLSDAALHRKFGRKFQDREQSDLFVRRRFRGRKLSAPPGHLLRRALRRQFLSLSHPRDGLFRSRRRL